MGQRGSRTESVREFFGLPGARGVAGALVELALWWVAGTVFWLATVSTVTLAETLAAALVSLIGAVLARLARRAMPFRLTVRREWLRWAATVPVAAFADAVRLARWLPGPGNAPKRTVELDALREGRMPGSRRPAETGWRAGGIIALSATPGSVVVDSDPATGKVLVHTLVEGWPGLHEKVLRAPGTGK